VTIFSFDIPSNSEPRGPCLGELNAERAYLIIDANEFLFARHCASLYIHFNIS
jgi:hypothetical protein